jgi:hypothetical protein
LFLNQIFYLKSHFMGVINNGILGGFSGKVGNVVGGTWRGKTQCAVHRKKERAPKERRNS